MPEDLPESVNGVARGGRCRDRTARTEAFPLAFDLIAHCLRLQSPLKLHCSSSARNHHKAQIQCAGADGPRTSDAGAFQSPPRTPFESWGFSPRSGARSVGWSRRSHILRAREIPSAGPRAGDGGRPPLPTSRQRRKHRPEQIGRRGPRARPLPDQVVRRAHCDGRALGRPDAAGELEADLAARELGHVEGLGRGAA